MVICFLFNIQHAGEVSFTYSLLCVNVVWLLAPTTVVAPFVYSMHVPARGQRQRWCRRRRLAIQPRMRHGVRRNFHTTARTRDQPNRGRVFSESSVAVASAAALHIGGIGSGGAARRSRINKYVARAGADRERVRARFVCL